MSFTLDLQRFAETVKERANQAVAQIVIAVATEIDNKSPVGNPELWHGEAPPGYRGGHFRANWQLGVDTVLAGEIPGIDPDGSGALGRIIAAIPDEAAGRTFNLTNNVPYAMRLEMGHSSQAPAGVVGITAVLFEQIVRKAVEESKG